MRILLSALGTFLIVLSACQSATNHTFIPPRDYHHETTVSPIRGSNSHDLSQDEAAGGHSLRKHIGQSDEQLRERLDRERHISAASTYTDQSTAELAVGSALQSQQARIQRWLDRPGGHPNLVLDYDSDHPLGRTLRRGEDQVEPCAHAVVVLRWTGPSQYYVLTTYPECRE